MDKKKKTERIRARNRIALLYTQHVLYTPQSTDNRRIASVVEYYLRRIVAFRLKKDYVVEYFVFFFQSFDRRELYRPSRDATVRDFNTSRLPLPPNNVVIFFSVFGRILFAAFESDTRKTKITVGHSSSNLYRGNVPALCYDRGIRSNPDITFRVSRAGMCLQHIRTLAFDYAVGFLLFVFFEILGQDRRLRRLCSNGVLLRVVHFVEKIEHEQ